MSVEGDWESGDSADWTALDKIIRSTLDRYGRLWDFKENSGDYYMVEDDWGCSLHQIEFQNLDLLQSDVIKSLQDLLIGYPDWLITVKVDVPGADWPGMGLLIYPDRIVDELQRDYLPERFRNIVFGTVLPAP